MRYYAFKLFGRNEEDNKIIDPKGCSTGRIVGYETISTACSSATFVAYYDPLPNN